VLACSLLACRPSGDPQVATDAPTDAPAPVPWTWQELTARTRAAMTKLEKVRVVYRDILGEGATGWDNDPRYPTSEVNCVVWLRQVITETYGDNDRARQQAMDRIRYYDGQVGFSLRKHYGARWMALDPAPLVRKDLSHCVPDAHFDVTLELDHFRASHEYSCPLYRDEQRSFRIDYTPSASLVQCAQDFDSGYYFLFGVPSQGYIDKYGSKSGPMGLVHGMVLEVRDPLPGSASRNSEQLLLHHGTFALAKVIVENLDSFVERMNRSLHAGYVVYTLDPSWRPSPAGPGDPHTQALQACEQTISGKGASRGMHEAPSDP